jgi:hypothetical protein
MAELEVKDRNHLRIKLLYSGRIRQSPTQQVARAPYVPVLHRLLPGYGSQLCVGSIIPP